MKGTDSGNGLFDAVVRNGLLMTVGALILTVLGVLIFHGLVVYSAVLKSLVGLPPFPGFWAKWGLVMELAANAQFGKGTREARLLVEASLTRLKSSDARGFVFRV